MRLYINKLSKVICVTNKNIKYPDGILGVGEYESSEKLKEFQKKAFLEQEGFTKVTTKQFKDLLKNVH